jgi:hypothetical protein
MTDDEDPHRSAAIARAYADLAARAAGMSRGWAVQATATAYGITPDAVIAAVLAGAEPGPEHGKRPPDGESRQP